MAKLTVTHSVTIDRPVEVVFDYLADNDNVTRWKKGLVEVRRTSEGPPGVGTTEVHVSEFLGRRSEVGHEITEYEPGRLMAFKTTSGPFPATGRFILDGAGGGTRLTIETEGEAHGVYALLGPLLAWLSKRQLQRDFGLLKARLEEPNFDVT
jgi:uncharacterized protein YndB with AHSA1/START domain